MADSPLSPHIATPAELKERIEAERAGAPFLVYRDSDGSQRLAALEPGRALRLGRDPDCGVCLEWDARVSRLHAELIELGGHWVVVDDGLSRNGTFLNGDPVAGRRRLNDGDLLEVGDTLIAFRDPGWMMLLSTATGGRVARPELPAAQRRVLVALCRPFKRAPRSRRPPPTSRSPRSCTSHCRP